jgi:hypothetical protein
MPPPRTYLSARIAGATSRPSSNKTEQWASWTSILYPNGHGWTEADYNARFYANNSRHVRPKPLIIHAAAAVTFHFFCAFFVLKLV